MRSNLWSAHLTKLSNRTWNRKYNTPVLFLCVSLNFCDHGVVFFSAKMNNFPFNDPSRSVNDPAYWFRSICSNQNCGLSRTHATFLLRQIFLCECKKYASVLLLLPLIVSNLSLCWNRFLRRMKTKRINTVIKKEGRTCELRPHLPPLFKLIYSRACSPQIT